MKYQTKSVQFKGKTLTLYSIDGATWSSRKEELTQIMERHENEKMSFGEIRGQLNANKPIAPKKLPEKYNKFKQADERAAQLKEAPKGKVGKQAAPAIAAKTGKAALQPVAKSKAALRSKPKVKLTPVKKVTAQKKAVKPAASPKGRQSAKPAVKVAKQKARKKAA